MSFNDNLLFLRSFIHHPKRVGSIIPSSRFLADSMVKQIPWPEFKAVAELGSGTGAITRAISTKVNKTTYSLHMKRQLSEYFSIEKIDFVPFNIPPAFVYVCRKRGTIIDK
ncbi:hypothetical protein D3C74_363200 [compost metagenome]